MVRASPRIKTAMAAPPNQKRPRWFRGRFATTGEGYWFSAFFKFSAPGLLTSLRLRIDFTAIGRP